LPVVGCRSTSAPTSAVSGGVSVAERRCIGVELIAENQDEVPDQETANLPSASPVERTAPMMTIAGLDRVERERIFPP
jgi:hypothetical protein